MAYTPNTLVQLFGGPVEGSFNVWLYASSDPQNTLFGSAYFSDGGKKGMQVGDLVWIINQTAAAPSITMGQVSAVASTTAGSLTFPTSATIQLAGPSALGSGNNFRNMFDGGDATINPFQRGTSITNIGATNTYTADRFFMVGGAGSSSQLVQSSDTTIAGFSKSFKWGRGQSSGSVSTLVVGQALESLDSIKAQGQPIAFSFYARADTGFASGVSGSIIGVQVSQGFGTDQGASALVNGTWTTQSDVISTTQVLTTTMTRYSFIGTVSTSATQLGVQLKYTPTATTAITAENVIMNGLQLEIGGVTPFEHRDVEVELALCQRYFFQTNEPGTSGTVLGAGTVAGTNTCEFVLQLPVQMRAAPTVTVTQGSLGALVIGGYVALTGLAAGSTHTVNYVSVVGNATAVSGQAVLLVSSSAATGKIQVSADL